ncbi:MAG: ferrous iron transport protein A [Myxococcales bacterium]|nr:ferrous iron transport protein A [Myxococcales bacterium]
MALPDPCRGLDRVPIGSRAIVSEVRCERSTARRLMELGLLPGTAVRVVRVAPMGCPIELRVRDFSLSIRRAEAARVTVDQVG